MDMTEVTASAYATCVKAGRCGAQGLQVVTNRKTLEVDPLCSYGVKDEGDHPVNCVTWGQASAYCHAQGKRLPTEWEWEWAALGAVDPSIAVKRPDPAPTCVGSRLAALKSWGAGPEIDAAVGTCAVNDGSDAGPEGVRGLYGNVAEWTSSRLPWAGMVARGASWRDPKNATVGLLNYSHDEVMADTAARNAYAPGTRRDDLGFRCVK